VQDFSIDTIALMAAEAGELAEAGSLLKESDALAAQAVHVVDHSDRMDAAAALKLRSGTRR
jgi:hypothetical protein